MFNLPDYQYIFPNAPFPHTHVPGGKAWYDLGDQNYSGLPESRKLLLDWLQSLEETTDIPLSQTILIGFSQGGAMTLDVGLSLPLAGLCSLSGYLHSQPQMTDSPSPPVLILHGRQDNVVPLQAAQRARDELVNLGVEVEYQEFDMGHEIQPLTLAVMENFIKALS